MSKIALITDSHLGARSDSELFAQHQMDFYTNTFFPTLHERGIRKIIHLGDFFENRVHLKLTTIRNALRFRDMLEMNDCDMTLLLGNHDVAFKDRNDLNSPEMLLESNKVYVISEPLTHDDMLFIPWVNKSNYQQCIDTIASSDARFCFGHFDIIGAKFSKYGEPSHEGFQPDMFSHFDKVFSGHYHTKSTIKNIEYLGSPFEYTWSDWDDVKGFHILDTETGELEFIPNPERIHVKIFSTKGSIQLVPKVTKLEGKIVKIETDETNTATIEQVVKLVGEGKAAEIQTIIHTADDSVDLVDMGSIKFDSTLEVMNSYVHQVYPEDTKLQGYLQRLFESCMNAD